MLVKADHMYQKCEKSYFIGSLFICGQNFIFVFKLRSFVCQLHVLVFQVLIFIDLFAHCDGRLMKIWLIFFGAHL